MRLLSPKLFSAKNSQFINQSRGCFVQYTNFRLPASGTTKNECGTVKGRKTSNKILDKKGVFRRL